MFIPEISEAKRATAVVVPMTEGSDVSVAFKSFNEFRYTIYGVLALFIAREVYDFLKAKAFNIGGRVDSMEHRLIRIETILEERLPKR